MEAERFYDLAHSPEPYSRRLESLQAPKVSSERMARPPSRVYFPVSVPFAFGALLAT